MRGVREADGEGWRPLQFTYPCSNVCIGKRWQDDGDSSLASLVYGCEILNKCSILFQSKNYLGQMSDEVGIISSQIWKGMPHVIDVG